MNTRYHLLVSRIFLALTIVLATAARAESTLFMGTIQFPRDIKTLPHIRIYYSGNKIKAETSDDTKMITFGIPELHEKNQFFLIVTEYIDFEAENNTIQYLKLSSSKQPYVFYELNRNITMSPPQPEPSDIITLGTPQIKQPKPLYEWRIAERRLDKDGRIPDDAIIICYNPAYIDKLEGGNNSVELPKIIIKNNIVALAGSEEKLHEKSIALLLSSLDSDAIHANIHQELKQDYQHKKLIALTT